MRKNEWACHVLHWVLATAKIKFDPVRACLDFEKVLRSTAEDQLKEAILIGYFFHFKQALRKCMVSIGIHWEQVKMAMTENCVDILCTIRKSEVLKKGMHCTKDSIKSSDSLTKSCQLIEMGQSLDSFLKKMDAI